MIITALNHSIKVDDDVFIELIHRKYHGRFRNVNESLRDALGLHPSENLIHVKNYSDEGDLIDIKEQG